MQPDAQQLLNRYPDPWSVLIGVAVLSFVLTGALYTLASRAKLLPAIRERDVHTVRKPRVGGVAMWLAVFIAFVFLVTGPTRYLLDFGGRQLWGILTGMVVILVTGLLDDVLDLPWWGQLLGQFLAGFSLVVGGVGVTLIRLPFNGVVHFAPIASAVFIVFWTMLMVNVMNFFDGLDGLAGSVAFFASVVLLFVSLRFGLLATATLSLVVAGATLGFLPWNWYPSKLFMGTVGSQLLGFLLATIAIISGAKLATAVLVLGVPVFDAITVILRRLKAHQNPLHADQRHLHHRLLKLGLPVPWAVILTDAVALVFGSLALHTQQTNEKGLLTLLLVACMLGFIGVTYVLERRAAGKV